MSYFWRILGFSVSSLVQHAPVPARWLRVRPVITSESTPAPSVATRLHQPNVNRHKPHSYKTLISARCHYGLKKKKRFAILNGNGYTDAWNYKQTSNVWGQGQEPYTA